MGGRTYGSALKAFNKYNPLGWLSPAQYLYAAIGYATMDNIKDDPEAFVHNLLGAIKNKGQGQLHTKLTGVNGNAELLQNLKYNEKKQYYIEMIYNMLKNNPELAASLTPEEKATFKAMKREYNSMISQQKNGGVIYAAKGTVLDPASGNQLEDLPFENPSKTKSNANVAAVRDRYKKSQE